MSILARLAMQSQDSRPCCNQGRRREEFFGWRGQRLWFISAINQMAIALNRSRGHWNGPPLPRLECTKSRTIDAQAVKFLI
jgi:hypothetical protein